MTKPQLIEKYKKELKIIIDPGKYTWDNLDFNEKPEGYNTVFEYLEAETEFNENEQTEINLITEFINELENLN